MGEIPTSPCRSLLSRCSSDFGDGQGGRSGFAGLAEGGGFAWNETTGHFPGKLQKPQRSGDLGHLDK